MYFTRTLVLSFFFIAPPSLLAQQFPRIDIFGGYSYLHIDTNGASSSSLNQLCNTVTVGNCPFTFQVHPNFNGWNAAGQINLNSWFGIKADFAGHYGTLVTAKTTSASFAGVQFVDFSTGRQEIYDFLVGPVFTYRAHRCTPFLEGLVGDEHETFSSVQLPNGVGTVAAPPSRDYLALLVGGGFDIPVGRRLRVRPVEVDYQFVNNSSTSSRHQNDLRVSTGVVFTFGER